MSEISERYRRVAGEFTRRARAVPEGAGTTLPRAKGGSLATSSATWWAGCRARSSPASGVDAPETPSVDENPLGAWEVASDAIQAALDDSRIAGRAFDMGPGRYTLEQAVAEFCIGDVLVHTWDLARATGLDEALDADEVDRLLEAMQPADEAMRRSGYYGARVEVPAGADAQTRLLAFTGRRP